MKLTHEELLVLYDFQKWLNGIFKSPSLFSSYTRVFSAKAHRDAYGNITLNNGKFLLCRNPANPEEFELFSLRTTPSQPIGLPGSLTEVLFHGLLFALIEHHHHVHPS